MKEEAYQRALRIASAKKKLREHFITSSVIIVVLVAINLLAGGGMWVQWPMLGLGISLIFHALAVYKKEHLEKYEEQTVKKEMKKYLGDEPMEEFDVEELELDELPELRKEWKDSDFV